MGVQPRQPRRSPSRTGLGIIAANKRRMASRDGMFPREPPPIIGRPKAMSVVQVAKSKSRRP